MGGESAGSCDLRSYGGALSPDGSDTKRIEPARTGCRSMNLRRTLTKCSTLLIVDWAEFM